MARGISVATATRAPLLSGGQQQRVAVARALVFEPAVVLMDEPLGALDKKLREELQIEFKTLHQKLGLTILYVTHDQEEAMTMSDRIAVMDHGRIEQVGTPLQIYGSPASHFVADFIGRMNFLPATVSKIAGDRLELSVLGVSTDVPLSAWRMPSVPDGLVTLAVRPQHMRIAEQADASHPGLLGTIETVVFAGTHCSLIVGLEGGGMTVTVQITAERALARGERILVTLDPDHVQLFPGRG